MQENDDSVGSCSTSRRIPQLVEDEEEEEDYDFDFEDWDDDVDAGQRDPHSDDLVMRYILTYLQLGNRISLIMWIVIYMYMWNIVDLFISWYDLTYETMSCFHRVCWNVSRGMENY